MTRIESEDVGINRRLRGWQKREPRITRITQIKSEDLGAGSPS